MVKETCSLQVKPNSCGSRSINKSCELFPICNAANRSKNGDLTPVQFNEKHSELKIDQVVIALEMLTKFTPQDETPLLTFSSNVSKGIYLLPNTSICLFEGRDGRVGTCPNNPRLSPKGFSKDICATCSTNPSTAASSRGNLPEIYLPFRQQKKKPRA